MSAVFTCPSCALQFPAPRGAGAVTPRCPRCGTTVAAAASSSTANPAAAGSPGPSDDEVYWCAACGDAHRLDQVYDDGGGKVICHGCYEVRAAAAVPAPSPVLAATVAAPDSVAHGVGSKSKPARTIAKAVRVSAQSAPVKTSSNRKRWIAVGAIVGAAGIAAIVAFAMRPGGATGSSDQAGVESAPGGPDANVNRVNRLLGEARGRAKQRDHAGAAALYAQMFATIEGDPAISGNRSLMADLEPARKEWALANDAAGLPALPGTIKPKTVLPKRSVGTAAVAADTDESASGDDASPDVEETVTGTAETPEDGESGPDAETVVQREDSEDEADTASDRASAKGASDSEGDDDAHDADDGSAGDASRVAALLDEADRLAKHGDKAGALTRYTDAFRAAGDRSRIGDAALRKRLVSALAARARLIGELRGGNGEGMRTMTLEALMADGGRALAAGKWEAALDALRDARMLVEERTKVPAERAADPHYVPALHGMAVAYLKLNRNPKAGELFDDKSPLGRASLGAAPPRELVWNRAVIDLIQKYKVMRAVKGLKEYLERTPNETDEGVINLFGTAIYTGSEQFDDEKKPPPLLVQAIALYEKRERQLESGRNGQRRWGINWIPAAEFDRKMALTRDLEARIQRLRTNDLARARQDLARAKRGRPVRAGGRVKYIVDEQEVRSAQERVNRVLGQIKDERAKIPQRNWLAKYDPIVPTLADVPATAIASAGSSADGDNGDTPADASAPPKPPVPRPADAGPAVADATPPRPPAPPRRTAPPTPPPPAPEAAPVRRVQRYAAAFAIDRFRLVTAAGPLGEATDVFLEDREGGAMRARVVARNERLALLEVDPASVNGGMPYLNLSSDFAGGTVRCAGLPSPSLFGPVVEAIEGRGARPPADATGNWTVSLPRHPRLAGAPLLDAASGALVGVVVAERDDPATQLPAVGVGAIRAFLSEHNALPAAKSGNPDPTGVYQVTIEE